MERRSLQRLTVADAHGEPGARAGRHLARGVDPVHLLRGDVQRRAPQPRVCVALADVDHVLRHVRREDEQRLLASSDAEALALADGVEMGAVVFADLLAVAHGVVPRFGQCRQLFVRGFGTVGRSGFPAEFRPGGEYFVHIAPLGGEFLLEKGRQVDLADEADALRILAFGRGEMLLGGDAPYFGFQQIPDGEQRIAQLFLRELAEKIALVLVGIAAGQQFIDRAAVGQRHLRLAAVVARGDVVGPEFQRFAQETVEFDLAVAQHVGIGRAPPFVFGEHILDHTFAVFVREVDHVQGDVQLLGHQFGEDPVVVPRTVALERARGVVPVDHEQADDLVSLLFQQPGRHRRIDAARKSDYHPCHSIPMSKVLRGARGASCGLRSRCVR